MSISLSMTTNLGFTGFLAKHLFLSFMILHWTWSKVSLEISNTSSSSSLRIPNSCSGKCPPVMGVDGGMFKVGNSTYISELFNQWFSIDFSSYYLASKSCSSSLDNASWCYLVSSSYFLFLFYSSFVLCSHFHFFFPWLISKFFLLPLLLTCLLFFLLLLYSSSFRLLFFCSPLPAFLVFLLLQLFFLFLLSLFFLLLPLLLLYFILSRFFHSFLSLRYFILLFSLCFLINFLFLILLFVGFLLLLSLENRWSCL